MTNPLCLYQHQFSAMGGPCSLKFYCSSVSQAQTINNIAEQEVRRFESKYSRYRADSILSQINAHAGEASEIDEETYRLLNYADSAHKASDGLFDITSGILRQAWDFKQKRVPSAKQLAPLLAKVGWNKIQLDEQSVQLNKGMELDFGGIVKEYAADAVAARLKEHGIYHGVIELGGDIAVLGPHPDGKPWTIGIRAPDSNQAALQINITHGCIASSGDYERFFIHNNRRYCHILNPKTGKSCEGIAGVTVIAPLCILAGSLSTIAMLKGLKKGAVFLDDSGQGYCLFGRDQQQKAYLHQQKLIH